MQISNASVPFPNAVAPFSPKVDQPSSGVTKDILVSSFSPLSESQSMASSQNSLSQKAVVYSPQSLARSANTNTAATSTPAKAAPAAKAINKPSGEPVESELIPGRQQGVSEVGKVVVEPTEEGSEDGNSVIRARHDGEITPVEDNGVASKATTAGGSSTTSGGLTPDERAVVGELAARDREVRTHEQQHQSVGGQHAGAASFSYQTGPDGVQYAVGGEVSIDISAVPNNPQATIEKMRTVKNAALAPAEPSAQDRSVASAANRMILQTQAELAAQQAEEFQAIRSETQQRQAESAESRDQQQDKQAGGRTSISEGVRTYESLIALGQRYENGLTPDIKLDEVV
ncbi:putative metalloprotease CJM1_0395 family protein [Alkalimarinus alittae]|uniref:SprA-related family protein n=1 Tax=Alkalimarinus alittae TaxID=2961619 RepID=A0ABY6N4P1_9ALTE|nr:putative metalloprotease CJM1_0395 family protein [Alkalimarinus alittae]UZE97092.1 hypothetical protein NKI27_04905 [Alkalimarinus alittae]